MKDIEHEAIGLAIRQLRIDANKTLLGSAKRCGHGKTWLAYIESGDRRLTFDDAKILCDYYGSDLNELSKLTDRYMLILQNK